MVEHLFRSQIIMRQSGGVKKQGHPPEATYDSFSALGGRLSPTNAASAVSTKKGGNGTKSAGIIVILL